MSLSRPLPWTLTVAADELEVLSERVEVMTVTLGPRPGDGHRV